MKNTIAWCCSVGVSFAAAAHPGHEAEDFFHAIAHDLMTPRGIGAVCLVGVAAAWIYVKSRRR
jgi:hypothetical protein